MKKIGKPGVGRPLLGPANIPNEGQIQIDPTDIVLCSNILTRKEICQKKKKNDRCLKNGDFPHLQRPLAL